MKVLARGALRVYPPRGEYQISVQVLEPLGKGSLQQAFEELKEKLEKEGLFDPARKRPLPMLPRRIGVVTSPTGAVLRDILRVLRSRYADLEVLVYPARVQGEGAAAEIAQGIRALNRLRRPRRDRARARRRQPRGPVGLQRGGRGARDRRLRGPHDLGRRPRDRLHDRRLRGRPARPDAVGRRRARGAGEGGAAGAGPGARRAPRRGAAPAAGAGAGARRGRDRAPRVRGRARPAAEPGPARRRARCAAPRRACGARSSAGGPHERRLRERLEAFRLDRQLAARRERLERQRDRLAVLFRAETETRRSPRSAGSRPRSTASRRSPCSARGYALVWEEARERLVRDAAEVEAGRGAAHPPPPGRAARHRRVEGDRVTKPDEPTLRAGPAAARGDRAEAREGRAAARGVAAASTRTASGSRASATRSSRRPRARSRC